MACLALLMLSGCGGGAGTPVPTPTPSGQPVQFMAGDSMTFRYSTTGISPASPEGGYGVIQSIVSTTGDGGVTVQELYDTGSLTSLILPVTFSLNADLQETGWSSSRTGCTNSPQADSPGAVYSLGKTWRLSYSRQCFSNFQSATYQVTNTGSVLGAETVTTPAGTFDAYKVAYVYTAVTTTRFLNDTSTQTTVTNYTCWRDKLLNREVACDWTTTVTPADAALPATTSVGSRRLTSLQVANHPASKPSVARFAGRWSLNWSGADAGACSVLVGNDGSLSGTCSPAAARSESWNISGSVDANGNTNASVTTGAAMAGAFSSPLAGSGTWSGKGPTVVWTASRPTL